MENTGACSLAVSKASKQTNHSTQQIRLRLPGAKTPDMPRGLLEFTIETYETSAKRVSK